MGVDYITVRYDKETRTWIEEDDFLGNDHTDAPKYIEGFPVWEIGDDEIWIAETWEHFWDDDGNIIQSVCEAYVSAHPQAWGAVWKYQWLRNEPEEHWPEFVLDDEWYRDLAV